MKTSYILYLSLFLFLSTSSFAQHPPSTTPKIVKGYYSIGDNAQKLRIGTLLPAPDSFVAPVVNKGYYSMEANSEKLPKKSTWKVQPKRPVLTKGYYSIGNSEKK